MGQTINVVGAVVVRDGSVLCAKRGPKGTLAGMWEFPGGKIEDGESPAAALAREIAEELDCTVVIGEPITTTIYEYDFGVVQLSTFYCTLESGTPAPREHEELRWARPSELPHLNWAPADIPAVEIVTSELS